MMQQLDVYFLRRRGLPLIGLCAILAAAWAGVAALTLTVCAVRADDLWLENGLTGPLVLAGVLAVVWVAVLLAQLPGWLAARRLPAAVAVEQQTGRAWLLSLLPPAPTPAAGQQTALMAQQVAQLVAQPHFQQYPDMTAARLCPEQNGLVLVGTDRQGAPSRFVLGRRYYAAGDAPQAARNVGKGLAIALAVVLAVGMAGGSAAWMALDTAGEYAGLDAQAAEIAALVEKTGLNYRPADFQIDPHPGYNTFTFVPADSDWDTDYRQQLSVCATLSRDGWTLEEVTTRAYLTPDTDFARDLAVFAAIDGHGAPNMTSEILRAAVDELMQREEWTQEDYTGDSVAMQEDGWSTQLYFSCFALESYDRDDADYTPDALGYYYLRYTCAKA